MYKYRNHNLIILDFNSNQSEQLEEINFFLETWDVKSYKINCYFVERDLLLCPVKETKTQTNKQTNKKEKYEREAMVGK